MGQKPAAGTCDCCSCSSRMLLVRFYATVFQECFPCILIHILRVPACRLKESHQLVMQTQSKSQAEVLEVVCYCKDLSEVNGRVLLLHSHTLIPPWGKVITVSPSTIPSQTSKCCSWLFVASTGIPFLPPDCLKIIDEAYSKASQEALRVTKQFFWF